MVRVDVNFYFIFSIVFYLEIKGSRMIGDETIDATPLSMDDTGNENEPNAFGILNSKSELKAQRMLSLTESYVVMCGIYIGTGILILPYTVSQLGALTWCAILLFSVVCMFVCSHLMNISGQRMLQVNEIVTEIRDPYPAIGEFAIGLIFRRLIITLLYTTSTLLAVGLILLSATALQGLLPIRGPSYDNVIRIWATIITIFITPVMYLANYSHLLIPSFIAISMSVLSLLAIVVNCFIARYSYDITPSTRIITPPVIDEVLLIPLGSIVFAVGGLPLAIPNFLTLSANPKKLTLSIFGCSSTLLIMFSIAGLVPYFFLGENILPSISTTFVEIMKVRETGVAFQLLTNVVQLFMVIHMLMACVLSINPIFLHLEEVLNIPYGK